MVAAQPQAQNDMAQYKRLAEQGAKAAQGVNWAGANFQGNGVYIAPSAGTTSTYAANSLVLK